MRVLSKTAVVAAIIAVSSRSAFAADVCPVHRTVVVVHGDQRKLWLCENGAATASFAVALGRRGLGKRARADDKTPLGVYALGRPRPSPRFGLFIPVDYPTDAQRRGGYTGGDIGVHGPDRRFLWAGRMTTWVNWTRGCVAAGGDAEIAAIADWVERHPGAEISIE